MALSGREMGELIVNRLKDLTYDIGTLRRAQSSAVMREHLSSVIHELNNSAQIIALITDVMDPKMEI